MIVLSHSGRQLTGPLRRFRKFPGQTLCARTQVKIIRPFQYLDFHSRTVLKSTSVTCDDNKLQTSPKYSSGDTLRSNNDDVSVTTFNASRNVSYQHNWMAKSTNIMCSATQLSTSVKTNIDNSTYFQQKRNISVLPEFVQDFSIWGGSGLVLKTINMNGTIPYWACICITNVMIRTSLLPLVIQGAKTSVKFASVAPEVQFLMTMFQKEMITLKEGGATPEQRKKHFWMNFSTLRQIYKIHGINPFAVFKVRA